MANLKYISSFIIFGQTRGIKWTVPSNFLTKKKQLSFYEGLRPIVASIKEGILLLMSTIVLLLNVHLCPRKSFQLLQFGTLNQLKGKKES